ncbi:MAG: RNA methyltransferase [Candidatus Nanopelagicales bacterium]
MTTPVGNRRAASKSASAVVAARKLGRRKERLARTLCVADGPQAVEYGLRTARINQLFVTSIGAERFDVLVSEAQSAGVEILDVDESTFAGLSESKSPQGILGVAELPVAAPGLWQQAPKMVVLLERAQDPGNVGTVLRTADAAGADFVLLGPGSADPFSAKCIRASAGSAFGIPVLEVASVDSALHEGKGAGLRVLGAAGDGARLLYGPDRVDLAQPTLWVFGNEAQGLAPTTLDACDELIAVPMFGGAESLNVGVAASLCMYATAEAQRFPTATS